jgi:hypothetical protein
LIRLLLVVALAGRMTAQVPGAGLPPEAATVAAAPSNLGFEGGSVGRTPSEWYVAQGSRIDGYSSETRKEGCRTGGGCAVIVAGPQVPGNSSGTLLQHFDATPYREKVMRLRAWVRLEGKRGGQIRVLFAADGEKKSADYVQKGGANEAAWTLAEVKGKVPKDAIEIHIGVSLSGKGTAWIDDVVFEPVEE